jgi:hypothetical protein
VQYIETQEFQFFVCCIFIHFLKLNRERETKKVTRCLLTLLLYMGAVKAREVLIEYDHLSSIHIIDFWMCILQIYDGNMGQSRN